MTLDYLALKGDLDEKSRKILIYINNGLKNGSLKYDSYQHYSDNGIDYIIRGRIYDALGRYTDAKADFQKALAKSPSNEDIYYYYAKALYKSGDSVNATAMMKNFISAKKGNPNSQNLKILFE